MDATQKLASTEADVRIDDARSVRNAFRVYLMQFGTFGDMNDLDSEFEVSVNGTTETFGISSALLDEQTATLVCDAFYHVGEQDVYVYGTHIVLTVDYRGNVTPRQLTYHNPGGRVYDVRQLL